LLDRIRTLEAQVVRAQDEADAAAAEASATKAAANGAAMDDALGYLREARAAQRMLKEKERMIHEYRIEVETLKMSQGDLKDQFNSQQLKLACLENELQQAQELNQSLVSDCEAYQRLLQKKTMDGSFTLKVRHGVHALSCLEKEGQGIGSERRVEPRLRFSHALVSTHVAHCQPVWRDQAHVPRKA
jgi:predicted RNase H-like nuclease (RuvC/YqgF family)